MSKYTERFYPEGFYHIYSHAVGSDNLYRSEENYKFFLRQYTRYINPVCGTYAYCLMPNHFHFLIKINEENDLIDYAENVKKFQTDKWNPHEFVMQQFSNFLNSYAKAFNKRYKRRGALFVDYIRSKRINSDRYLLQLVQYIHFNPVKHGFCKKPIEWAYCSYETMRNTKFSLLKRAELLELFGGIRGFDESHKHQPDIKDEEFDL